MARQASEGFVFNLASYARRGPGQRDHFTSAQRQQIARTVGRTPEVMVKVLSQGASDIKAVRRHLDYIARKGEVDLETDDGQQLCGRQAVRDALDDWDLELDALRVRPDLTTRSPANAPRLVHKLMFSMPPGTPSGKVLKAVQNFCREEFSMKHRYAMALHTDEPHPHVHVVIKAVSEEGHRLNIRKATLRQWREGFAHNLRALGVAANATPRVVRAVNTPHKSDGIYRASEREDSRHWRERAESVTKDLSSKQFRPEAAKAKLIETRKAVCRAWWTVGEILLQGGEPELAAQVKQFAERLGPPQTEREWLAAGIFNQVRSQTQRNGRTR